MAAHEVAFVSLWRSCPERLAGLQALHATLETPRPPEHTTQVLRYVWRSGTYVGPLPVEAGCGSLRLRTSCSTVQRCTGSPLQVFRCQQGNTALSTTVLLVVMSFSGMHVPLAGSAAVALPEDRCRWLLRPVAPAAAKRLPPAAHAAAWWRCCRTCCRRHLCAAAC